MSTRCLIGYRDRDNDIVSYSYCHYDGYPKGVGCVLHTYYNTPELAKKISTFGDMDSIHEYYEKINKIKGGSSYRTSTYEEYSQMNDPTISYIYIYNYNCWMVRPTFFYVLEDEFNNEIKI